MTGVLTELLNRFRDASKSEREKGTYFENLAKVFFLNDPLQAEQFEEVWTFAEWAKAQGLDGKDTGIDLVAKIRDTTEFCAVQCKFYQDGHRIQKADLDSFFTASGKKHFTRRIIIDTTNAPWSSNAEDALKDQQIQTNRIGFSDIEQSPIDWRAYIRDKKVVLADKKALRPHQTEALAAVRSGFETADRGKLIMACGTGKTFTGLKIAENLAGIGKMVLYLVPSLSLMSQSVREWSIDTETPLRSFAVCSDVQVGKRRSGDDLGDIDMHDLAYPATTDAAVLAAKVNASTEYRMTVVFCTYQSIEVIARAQKLFGLPEFDLIICDEAHRTTGVKFADEDESNFIKIHNQEFIQGKKRLYMTATPRIYGDAVKTKANEVSAELCSMDDESLYGQVLFQRGFSWAVQNGLLTDYKVIVLAVDEAMVSAGVQKRLSDGNSELLLDDATKIIGCYKALTKVDLKADIAHDPVPMKRALAFCKDIKSSKLITNEFSKVVEEFLSSGNVMDGDPTEKYQVDCELDHVDGTFNAKDRTTLLNWLKEDTQGNTCRILSNARCLSEGVDVPALDAIMFLHPRKSQIDVVQSVGRVMRRAPGKKMGYVILPIGIPAGMEPEEALNNNEKYKIVWQILNALRAHDDRFDSTINKIDLGVDISEQIEIIAVSNTLPDRTKPLATGVDIGKGSAADDDGRDGMAVSEPVQTSFLFDEITKAILAKIVKKCGKRAYWEDWAGDIAKIAQTHITRITGLLAIPGTAERKAFDDFLGELRDDLNDSISEAEAIEMLAQHIITKPVFDALFDGYNFASENPVSRAMQSVLDVLNEHNLEKESESLQKFYASVKMRAEGIDKAEGKQKIIVELYDKFFRNAFPKMTEKLGIVYTPVEVVDFILHSVNDVLQSEFGQTIGSKGVHIIDPFTGTGTFITRLLQSGLIKPEELAHKYANEIHANEIVLLAYYIAAINIEAVYHSLAGGNYKPFQGICLTDTFQLYEKDDLISNLMVDNSSRRQKQKDLDIRVIIGNPPYSAGQSSANDNNANVAYPNLDRRIQETYAARSTATLKNGLYDSYIRAIRWATDRLGSSGVMAFVCGGAWVDRQFADGLRASLKEEYTSIYIFQLRGDIRKNMLSKGRAGEGGNIFGSGSMTGIAIAIFVKNPEASVQGNIFIYDIGADLDQNKKLKIIRDLGGISGISRNNLWKKVVPDSHNDWINQRNTDFDDFIALGDKDGEKSIFNTFSGGVKTNRDAWCINSSRENLYGNIQNMIGFYENQREKNIEKIRASSEVTIEYDASKISWSSGLISILNRNTKIIPQINNMREERYRPFFSQWLYFDNNLNDRQGLMKDIFRESESNIIICTTGKGARSGFSALISDVATDYHFLDTSQCFPLKNFGSIKSENSSLFATNKKDGNDGIKDDALLHFRKFYSSENISKEDIFYYVYGILHSNDYRVKYQDNLVKELPRIPLLSKFDNFLNFADCGRRLAKFHLDYESVDPFPITYKQGDLMLAVVSNPEAFYRVEKMKFGGSRPNVDRSTVVYNNNITMTNIPLEAYDYVVNGKSALEWVMERQCVKTDKDSGIVNDANRYAIETVGDPAYPLKLFQRVITVSLETMKIVRSLPALDI